MYVHRRCNKWQPLGLPQFRIRFVKIARLHDDSTYKHVMKFSLNFTATTSRFLLIYT